jgi:hypothetical protein
MNGRMRVVIAPGDEGEEHARAKQIVDAQRQIVAEAQSGLSADPPQEPIVSGTSSSNS